MDLNNVCVFDLEPQKHEKEVEGKWENPQGFGFACGVVWSKRNEIEGHKGGYKHYFENDVQTLIEDLKTYSLVVGFNQTKFDYGVLGAYTDFNFDKIPSFDILKEIYAEKAHHVSLGNLAKANFSKHRGGNLYKAVEWYKKGNVTKAKGYCEKDVEITRELFFLGLEKDCIDFHRWDNPKDPDTIDTSYWNAKVEALISGNEFKLEAGWRKEKVVKCLSLDIFLEMENETGDGSPSHAQEAAMLGLLQNIRSMCDGLKAVGSPIEAKNVLSSIRMRFGEKNE